MIIGPPIGIAVGAVLLVTGSLLGWWIFPEAIDDRIIDRVTIRPNTDQYERWEVTPQALQFKVYLFNVTNPNEIQNGAMPIVKEVGPYIYLQYRSKHNISFNSDKTRASYTDNQDYIFDRQASAPLTENDPVTLLNLHLNGVLQVAERDFVKIFRRIRKRVNNTLDQTPILNMVKRFLEQTPIVKVNESVLQVAEGDPVLSGLLAILNGLLDSIFGPDTNTMFQTVTVRQFLFEGIEFCRTRTGIAGTVCDVVEERNIKTIRKDAEGHLRFSMFYHKNNSNDGLFQINTGIARHQLNLEIEQWEREKFINFWKNNPDGSISPCNYINGTDSAGFPPFRKRRGSMFIYSTDICRSVEIFYSERSNYRGIPGYRFRAGENFLNELGPEYGTECFCPDMIVGAIKQANGCLYPGAMDLSTCYGVPVVLTLPHMLDASTEYTSLINGQTPDIDRHAVLLDVEPNTGTPLRGGRRVQFNMFLRPIQNIGITERLRPSLFPAIWIDEGIELNDENTDMIKDELLRILTILDVVHWTTFSVGIATMVVMSGWYYYSYKKEKTTNRVAGGATAELGK